MVLPCPTLAASPRKPGLGHAAAQQLASQAVQSLSRTQYAIADAIDHVPLKPGLYAVYADQETWQELNLEIRDSCPLLSATRATRYARSPVALQQNVINAGRSPLCATSKRSDRGPCSLTAAATSAP